MLPYFFFFNIFLNCLLMRFLELCVIGNIYFRQCGVLSYSVLAVFVVIMLSYDNICLILSNILYFVYFRLYDYVGSSLLCIWVVLLYILLSLLFDLTVTDAFRHIPTGRLFYDFYKFRDYIFSFCVVFVGVYAAWLTSTLVSDGSLVVIYFCEVDDCWRLFNENPNESDISLIIDSVSAQFLYL